ncbi:rab-GTPase-TBC domain-containing protein [Tribonema minus]|uniref:Rab-GTPase-TBC domain-containing protein n=1 Tax=Tribonema minus TaxID=303371 RepID=A0A836C8P8_9STRA|nr:rab-GTPase-TBC domain-containing protein [Tribonema minus]
MSPPQSRTPPPAPPPSSARQQTPGSSSSSARGAPPPPHADGAGLQSRPSFRDSKYSEILGADVVSLPDLRRLAWNGVPPAYRPTVWKLLCGYMPANRDRRAAALARKRREYAEAVAAHFAAAADAARSAQEQALLRQILVDIPRTAPDAPLFAEVAAVQRSMTRALYVWAQRHPASGYVQGINDLLTPFYVVFLGEHVVGGEGGGAGAAAAAAAAALPEEALKEIEADAYWCLTKLLDNIQDHYTAMQPGLQRMVLRLEELVRRIDLDLHAHLAAEGVQFIQFAFRWMNCLLMRELPLPAIVRAWDTYLSEEDGGFESFHVYVCAALLCKFSPALLRLDFAALVLFLQDMPTRAWSEADVEPLLSQAYILSTLFENSSAHLNVTS